MSSRALTPTVECRLSNVVAAAIRTSGRGSLNALLKKYKSNLKYMKVFGTWNKIKQNPFCAHKNNFFTWQLVLNYPQTSEPFLD